MLFLPLIILGVALLALLAGNLLQRNFRSSWQLVILAASLAFASLIYLRIQLPLTSNFSAWWAGEGLISSISFNLDEISWPYALIVCGLFLAFLLKQVQQAMSASWLDWGIYLLLTISSLAAVLSGDLPTLFFFWVLVDVCSVISFWNIASTKDERQNSLGFLTSNIAAIFLLQIAWLAMDSSDQIGELLLVGSAVLRLRLFSPSTGSNSTNSRSEFVRLLPWASIFVLIARSPSLSGWGQYGVLFVLLVLMLGFTFQSIFNEKREVERVEKGFAVLALAAAVIGQPYISASLGILTLASSGLLSLARFEPKLRFMMILAALLLFSWFPIFSVMTADYSAPLLIMMFLVEATVIVGWIRLAYEEEQPSPSEAWMRVVRTLGISLIPIAAAFLLFTSFRRQEPLWWAAAFVFLLTGILHVIINRFSKNLPVSITQRTDEFFSLRWLQIGLDWLFLTVSWILRMMNRLLEGRAGVLWALLVIALLLSLASQIATGG
jgi:hypothetical protein